MEGKRKITIAVIAVLVVAVLGLGIAFAAFSRNLTINGNGTIQSSAYRVVFEGLTNAGTLDAPTIVGTAQVVAAPTINSDATDISNYAVSLRSPGDSITYNFKIHNTGDYAASISSMTHIRGNSNASADSTGINFSGSDSLYLTSDSTARSENASTLQAISYKFYYTNDNTIVGLNSIRDCLTPGESENVSLRIVFSSTNETDPSVLPSSAITLDQLGIRIRYGQATSCPFDYTTGHLETNAPFENLDLAYYRYENKSFIGTGVNNVIISENIINQAQYASAVATECSDGSAPVSNKCPEGETPVFASQPAATAAANYCTGGRLMTKAEFAAWGNCNHIVGIDKVNMLTCNYGNAKKVKATYNGSYDSWWIADAPYSPYQVGSFYAVTSDGQGMANCDVTSSQGVRPVVDIPSGATMTGSGTQASPYVITVSQ